MNFDDLLATIESTAFSVELNVVSDLRTFLWAMEQQETVRSLTDLLQSKEWQEKVTERIAHLCEQPVDPNCENVADTALAIYLWLLDKHDQVLAHRCGEKVLEAPKCWWAWRVAREIAPPAARNGASAASGSSAPQPLPRVGQ